MFNKNNFPKVIITREMLSEAEKLISQTKVNRTVASEIDTLTGILGEFVFAQYFYDDWQKNFVGKNKGKEDFPDFEVKTSAFPFNEKLNLLVREDYAKKRKPKYYVQIIIDVRHTKANRIKAGTTAYICGYASAENVENAPLKDFGSKISNKGGYRCKYINIMNLEPISKLKKTDKISLSEYILTHISPEDKVLQELYRETHLKILRPRMLSGPLQGMILEFISKMIKPEHILEIGTYTGYSAICLAKGLQKNGTLDTIEINDELENFSRKYFQKSGLEDKIIQHTGNALEIIPKLNKKYDLVFIDAEKKEYLDYYKLIINRIESGSYILADNVFWDKKVLEPAKMHDETTKTVDEFNKFIAADKRVEQVIIPIRDGLTIIRKK